MAFDPVQVRDWIVNVEIPRLQNGSSLNKAMVITWLQAYKLRLDDLIAASGGGTGTITCWDGSTIPDNQSCPPSQTCWDGSVIAATASCPASKTCWDGSIIAATASCPASQTCWDGSVIAATDTCPASQTCWDGSVIAASDTCPPSQTCWDGSVIAVSDQCPVQTQTCWDGSVIPVDQTCPPPPAVDETYTADGYLLSPSLNGLPDIIPSSFDSQADGLAPRADPGSGEKKFREACGAYGEFRYDDPIVFRGQPGKSHLHLFYGNKAINANSTYESLRDAAGLETSTCNESIYMLNTSGYWMPAMLRNGTEVFRPNNIIIYYERVEASNPQCDWTANPSTGRSVDCLPIPQGLRSVAGYNPSVGGGDKTLDPKQKSYWSCGGGSHPDILSALQDPKCALGQDLVANIINNPCWDGQYLDTPDHRSHLMPTSTGSWGYPKCPSTHPHKIPLVSTKALWNVTEDMLVRDSNGAIVGTTLSLSSDAMMSPGKAPGYSLHGDYFFAWDRVALNHLEVGCYTGKYCNNANLGDGWGLKGAYPAVVSDADRAEPIPTKPVTGSPATYDTPAGTVTKHTTTSPTQVMIMADQPVTWTYSKTSGPASGGSADVASGSKSDMITFSVAAPQGTLKHFVWALDAMDDLGNMVSWTVDIQVDVTATGCTTNPDTGQVTCA